MTAMIVRVCDNVLVVIGNISLNNLRIREYIIHPIKSASNIHN